MQQVKGKVIVTLCIVILLYAIFNSIVGDFLLKKNPHCIKAQIYKETLAGKTHPSFGYFFLFDNEKYTGLMAEDKKLKIGDTICVVFLKTFPSINRPLTYFDSGEIKCNCK